MLRGQPELLLCTREGAAWLAMMRTFLCKPHCERSSGHPVPCLYKAVARHGQTQHLCYLASDIFASTGCLAELRLAISPHYKHDSIGVASLMSGRLVAETITLYQRSGQLNNYLQITERYLKAALRSEGKLKLMFSAEIKLGRQKPNYNSICNHYCKI